MKTFITYLLFSFSFISISFPETYFLKSPDGRLVLKITAEDDLKWEAAYDGIPVILSSNISLKLEKGLLPDSSSRVKESKRNSVLEYIDAAVPVKNKRIEDKCNELILRYKDFEVVFRAYNDGAAYRFGLNFKDEKIKILWENAAINFPQNMRVFFPEEKSPDFISHYERSYKDTMLSGISGKQYCSLPVLLADSKGIKVLISEADLFDYPNMFMSGTGKNSLTALFPKCILDSKPKNDRDEQIIRTADYIALTRGKRTLPWRIFVITNEDKNLLETEMVYKLSSPSELKNTEWIKPGRVAWDWWNALNIYDVDFKSGINTSTYKYYIDFASRFGIEYIILDEGWSLTTHDLLHTISDLDLPAIIKYGKEKNVSVILWVLWNALNEDMEKILDTFASWGVKGIKVDFMQRGDQGMVNFYERCSVEAAKRNLVVDFHGAYKPSGINRKYPNVLSLEGVKGLEHSKWSRDVTPVHDVTLPFIRMAAGPMDFTPGAMINSAKDNFNPVFSEPMSQGTRCHQAAMYVVYTSPLQMFADNPSNYLKDTSYTRFISLIPSTWDETKGLDSRAGEFCTVARKKDNNWFIGAMTDWNKRQLKINLDFLENKEYMLEYLEDGVNADRHASDYNIKTKTVRGGEILELNLAPGGGWVGILKPVNQDFQK